MQLREFNINIDIIHKNKIDNIKVIQKDSKTTVFNIQLTKSGIPINLQNIQEIKVVFQDIHGNKAIMVCEADKNNIIRCELSDEVMNLDIGKVKMEVVLYGEDSRLTSRPITFTILKGIYNMKRI